MRRFVDFLIEKHGSIEKGVEKIFSKYDTDKSGSLSREEFIYALDFIDD
jgi:Ca2+-binding EF-hand superfamily protein